MHRELLASTARSFSHVRIREIAVSHDLAKNKGTMLNAAIRASRVSGSGLRMLTVCFRRIA